MLFLMFWEATDSLSPDERLKVAAKLQESGLLSSSNLEIVRWDSSPDGRDILVVDAEAASDVENALESWGRAAEGYLKFTNAAPVSSG